MKATLRDLFRQKFNYSEYRKVVLQNLLHAQELMREPEFLEETNDGDRIYGLGYLRDADGKEIGLYYTNVTKGDVRHKRVGFRKMMKKYTDFGVDAAITVFADKEHWRLSYMCDLKGGVTAAKRFSYIMGDNGMYVTPVNRLSEMAGKRIKLEDIHDAFSVEALSDEFFDEYHIHYDRIVAELARQGKSGAVYHDYVKKLMGRIVFLHFLQKKGWLCGDSNFMLNTFNKCNRRSDYLESVLEPLFFGILNTEPAKRELVFSNNGWQQHWVGQWANIPYLNGGLFERDAVDNLKIVLPETVFSNLFAFLASYNFTVDENDPDDAEIGVDPEMLGKIFESLLEDNKAKGAFYTPKEIVRYMCKESLIAYIATRLPDVADSVIRTFVEHHEMQPELAPYRDTLSQALREVKICDPAIGSGAFPMGLLNELWRCREVLEPTESRVALKKEIIENNIYGVDIERGAIDIARLRFWLSIVVDSEQAEPLPNFDYKFMQGNSLIESYQGFDLSRIAGKTVGRPSTSTQLVIGLDSDLSRKNLQKLLREYFSVTDHQKKATMRQAINDEVKRLILNSAGGTPTFLAKLEQLDPSANQEFFLWHTWFKDIFDGGGFDIVIGNPPYINIANIKNDDYRELLKKSFRSTRNKCDLYAYFIENAFMLTSDTGIVAYIVPITWKATDSFRKLREIIFKEHSILQIVNLNYGTFDATVKPMILLMTSRFRKDYIIEIFREDFNPLYEICSQEVISTYDLSIDTESDLTDKELLKSIEKDCITLGNIIKFSRGIKTSNDKRFVGFQHLSNDYKKVFRGRNIRPYSLEWMGEYIWYRPDLMKEKTGCLPHTKTFFEVPEKLVMQRIGMQLSVAYDDKQNYFLDTVNVSRYDSIDQSYSLKYICGLLNSKVVNFWYHRKYQLPTIGGYELDSIPIPRNNSTQHQIIEIVEKILSQKQQSSLIDTSKLERQIDDLVYKLYNLTPEEIAIIEQKT